MGHQVGFRYLFSFSVVLRPLRETRIEHRYNHGGGYSYRLCPANETLTEACFQRTPLDFDRSAQVLRWSDGKTEYAMGDQAVFVDGDVTFPVNSTWARNPIPRIFDSKLGLHDPASCPGPSTRATHSPPGCLAFPAPCPWDTYETKGLLPCPGPTGSESQDVSAPHGGRRLRCDGDGMSQCSAGTSSSTCTVLLMGY